MKRFVSTLAAAIVAAVSTVTLVTGTPAAAFGQETFGCRISPGVVFRFTPQCTNITGARTYNVGFLVENLSGSYAFAWQVTGPYTSVISGCTATSASCGVSVDSRTDSQIAAEVTISQDGRTALHRSIATINAVCGSMLC